MLAEGKRVKKLVLAVVCLWPHVCKTTPIEPATKCAMLAAVAMLPASADARSDRE